VRVLLIDDDEDLRTLLTHYIRGKWADARVDEFDPIEKDFPDARFALGDYDVLILDYMLGRGDGLEWLQRFKQRADCPKILFLTGAGNEIIAVRAMKAGADDYQRKQELTREKLLNSLRDLTASDKERTSSPELSAPSKASRSARRSGSPASRCCTSSARAARRASTSPRASPTTSRWW
jgi:DNA-binding response OmpR family regulator